MLYYLTEGNRPLGNRKGSKMRKHEIGKVLNGIITEALNDGYGISFGELRGCYSDCETQTVLAKGPDRIIVWASVLRDYKSETITVNASRIHLETTGEGGHRYTQSLDRDYHWSDDWKKGLFFEKSFYHVGAREDDWYVESQSEAEAAAQKHYDRCKARRVITSKELEMTPRLMSIVRKLKGFKTVKAENVRVTRRYNEWAHKREYIVRNVKSGNSAHLG